MIEIRSTDLREAVTRALAEDIGTGDISGELLDTSQHATATLRTRAQGVICGIPWVEEVLRQVDQTCSVDWLVDEGDTIEANCKIAVFHGLARSLLTAERTMLNFLQLLSSTATKTKQYADAVAHTKAVILDTRKTIPGLRLAQKYAVRIGGGQNHRVGLYDAFLIKENHKLAMGSIAKAVQEARSQHHEKPLEVEVESLEELEEARVANVERVLLDNFDLKMMRAAVTNYGDDIELEASGGITLTNLRDVAETGVDYISLGTLTKDVKALDLSFRVDAV